MRSIVHTELLSGRYVIKTGRYVIMYYIGKSFNFNQKADKLFGFAKGR